MRDKEPCPTCPKEFVITPELIDDMVETRRRAGGSLTDDDKYIARLEVCAACEHNLSGGLCRICGAFVRYRALDPDAVCPLPAGDRWR